MILSEEEFLQKCKVCIGKHCRITMPFRLEKYRDQVVTEQEILELFPDICQLVTLTDVLKSYNITLKSYNHQGCYTALELHKMETIARWAVKHKRRVSDLYMIQHFPGRNVSALYKYVSVQIKRVQSEDDVMNIRFDLPEIII